MAGVAAANVMLGQSGIAPGTRLTAADILSRAAAALDTHPGPTPRPNQYIFRDTWMLTAPGQPSSSITPTGAASSGAGQASSSPGSGQRLRMWTWESVDGSAPEEALAPETQSCRPNEDKACTGLARMLRPESGLLAAPYTTLSTLPTDPDQLLAALRDDLDHAGMGSVESWWMITEHVPRMPSAQLAALYRAAAKLDGLDVYPAIPDGTGRTAMGVGRADPTAGLTLLLFDPDTYRYLGTARYLGTPPPSPGGELRTVLCRCRYPHRDRGSGRPAALTTGRPLTSGSPLAR